MQRDRNNAALRVVPTSNAPGSEEARDLDLARAGDLAAWERLYAAECDAVLRYACLVLGDFDAAEDAMQEVFARALTALERFRGDSTLRTWLRRIALNVCREQRRRQSRDDSLRTRLTEVDGGPLDLQGAERGHIDRARTEALYAALNALPERLREAFVLRELIGVDAAEAATTLGVSRNHLAVRVYRARKLVRSALAQRGWTGGNDD